MPLVGWPKPCPVCLFHGRVNLGRVYGKKTCGNQCGKEFRTWSASTAAKMTHLANLTIQERFEEERIEQEIDAEREAERAQLPPEPESQYEKPDSRPGMLKQLDIRDMLNPNNLKPKGGDLDEANELPASKSSTP